jgi:hypothetical protein
MADYPSYGSCEPMQWVKRENLPVSEKGTSNHTMHTMPYVMSLQQCILTCVSLQTTCLMNSMFLEQMLTDLTVESLSVWLCGGVSAAPWSTFHATPSTSHQSLGLDPCHFDKLRLPQEMPRSLKEHATNCHKNYQNYISLGLPMREKRMATNIAPLLHKLSVVTTWTRMM